MTRRKKETKRKKRVFFPVVGIGASAGGLNALEEFFKNMPPDSGTAFVLVQHPAPTHKSIMADIIKNYTRMKVKQVKDGMHIEPNCVYIMPPNSDMALLHGVLHLIEPYAPRGHRTPIDFFFRSLAQDQEENAICIVLSGSGSDGTLGLKSIKGEGGMAMVQEPKSAQYEGMPESAVHTGLADYILPPEKIAEQLIFYLQHIFPHGRKKAALLVSPGSDYLWKIFILMHSRTGHDFSLYKKKTITRRIERRMTFNRINNIEDYTIFLQKNTQEVDLLFRDFLIGVSNFFRSPEAFKPIKEKVIPSLFENRPPDKMVRIWVPGCSTGEEAYSIAMLVREHMISLKQKYKTRIFATDIDGYAIEKARTGKYPESIFSDVPGKYLKHFFSHRENNYQVKKEIRDMILFAEQSVIKDPPFSNLDLISCRNLLIYMEKELQKKVLSIFAYSLNPDGYLFLGTSESIGSAADFFTGIDKKWRLYRSRGITDHDCAALSIAAPDSGGGAGIRAGSRHQSPLHF